jgi:UTP--glucose-1-phosphate uridylyltransferase
LSGAALRQPCRDNSRQTTDGLSGLHLLAPSIYEVLEEIIRDDVRDRGEFQLTRAQKIQRRREGCLALEMTAAE